MGTMPAGELKMASTGPKRPRADDRDGERTPMQWNGGKNAGFSNGSPWLPVETGYRRYNVQAEGKNHGSIYSWYSQLIQLRKSNRALRDGQYVPLESGNRDVFAFGRAAAADETALIILNTSSKEQNVRLTGLPDDWHGAGKVLLASPQAEAPHSQAFTIAPYGVLVVE